MGHRATASARVVRGVRCAVSLSVGALVLGLSGCGDEPAPGAAAETSQASVTPSAPDDRPVSDRFVSGKDLPGKWRDSEPPGAGFKQLVCGVDIEPREPVDGGAIRYSQGGLGPFLAQHIRVHSDATTPAAVVRDLKASLPGCTSYETKGNKSDSPTVRFDVEPLEVEGLPANAVAWRQQATTGGPTTDMVLMTDDHALVAFVSYAIKNDPDPQVLEDAVGAFDRMD